MTIQVSLKQLEDALMFSSFSSTGEVEAFVCRATGAVIVRGPEDLEEEPPPEGLGDDSLYACLPGRRNLDLGQPLVFGFLRAKAPQLEGTVRGFFRGRGAYARFKNLLERHDLLDAWHVHEESAGREALIDWAQGQGFELVEAPGAVGKP